MLLRVALLLSAAALFGTAIGVVQDGSSLGFWLSFAAGFLGSWGLVPLSQPLLERHRALKEEPPHSPAA